MRGGEVKEGLFRRCDWSCVFEEYEDWHGIGDAVISRSRREAG